MIDENYNAGSVILVCYNFSKANGYHYILQGNSFQQ